MKEYEKSNISLARALRKQMTPAERKLWYEYLRDYPIRFQRQKPILNFIVDFYCAKAGLAIELDGGGHYTDEQKAKDLERTEMLKNVSIRIIRICNTEVMKNFKGTCDYIDDEIKKSMKEK